MIGLGLGLGFHRAAAVGPAYITIPDYATIATFGDSITVNVNATSTETAWVGIVSAAVGATLTNKGVSGTVLQNSADSGGGARTSNGRDRFAADLLGANLKAAVFIAYGFNDARYTGAPTTFNVAGYTNDLREVLNGLIIGGYAAADIYVGTPYYITDTGLATGSTGFTGQTRSGFEAFVQAALDVAAEFGVKSCNLYTATNNATYIADVDANDHIHPENTGHAMIADAWKTLTFVSNTRAKPTVSASVISQTVTVTASAVTGAASYEYVLVANPNDASTNTTGTFTSVTAGDYYAKARAVFGDGSKGPWAFTSSAVTVASSGAGVVWSDDFATGTAGSNLTGRTATGAGTWAANSNNTGSSLLSGVGTLIGNTSAGSSPVMIHKIGDITFGSGVFAEAVISVKSTSAGLRSSALTLRATGDTSSFTGYFLIINGQNVRLLRAVTGTNTTVGTYSNMAVGDHTARLELRSGSQKVYIDSVLVGDHTDAPVATFGDGVGTRMSSNTTATWNDVTGPHIKSVSYGTL